MAGHANGTAVTSGGMAAAIAIGAAAGLAGTVVMTAFQKLVEMPLTGRSESYEPANMVQRLTGVRPRGKRSLRRLN